ncbi:hypothetical protein GCK72_022205 [Caenorhabditis remanei]|uniref:Uncharacterized protein n=1 Tax=Caenorhabditis remanei TaxID=31234 RepID=A0A6A5FT42_CAERE|nr:hypothetical protein GCK72_022205 [Caenorhabditis remanei]KAF1745758.1 hypothetical protein GCK72_022205 [Caenorhabditis remanei]
MKLYSDRLLESPSSIAGSARSTPAIQQLEHDVNRRFSQPQQAPPPSIDPRIPHHLLLHHGTAPNMDFPQRSRSVAPQKNPPAKPRQNRKNRALTVAPKMSESERLFSQMTPIIRETIFTLCSSKTPPVPPYLLPPHIIRQLVEHILQLIRQQTPQSTGAQMPTQMISQVPTHNLQQANRLVPSQIPVQMQTQMNSQAPPQDLQQILQFHQAAQLATSQQHTQLAPQEPQKSVQGNPPSILQQMAHQIQQLNSQPTPSPASTRMATPVPHWNIQQMSQQIHQLESRSAFSPVRSRMATPVPQWSLQQTPQQILQQIAQQIGTQIPQQNVQQDAQQVLQKLSQQVCQLNAQPTFSPLHAQIAHQAPQKDLSHNSQQILQLMSQQVHRLDAQTTSSPATPQITSPAPQQSHEQIVRQIIQQFLHQIPQLNAQSMPPQLLTQLLQQISHKVPPSVVQPTPVPALTQTCLQVPQSPVPQQIPSQMVTQNTVTVPVTVIESRQSLTINAPEVQLPKETSSTGSRIFDRLSAVKMENLEQSEQFDADLEQQRIAKLELTEDPAETSTSQTISAEDDALQGLLMMMKQDQFSQGDRQSTQPEIGKPTIQYQRLPTPSPAAQKRAAIKLQKEQQQQQRKQAQQLKQQQLQEQKRQKQLQQQQRKQQLLEQQQQKHAQQVYHQQWLQQQQHHKQEQQNPQMMMQKQHQHQLELQRLQQMHQEKQLQQQLTQQQNLMHMKAQQQTLPRPPPAHSVPIGMDPRLCNGSTHGIEPRQLSLDPRLSATDPQRFGSDPKLFGTDVRHFLAQLSLPPGTDVIQFLSQFQSLSVHRPPNQNPPSLPETTMPVGSSTQTHSASQFPVRPQENETHSVNTAQSNGLSPEELAKSLFTPQVSKPVTPNILRKPRGNEVNTSSNRLADHPLYGSTIPPSVQSLSGLAQPPVPAEQQPAPSAPNTPRRRKQILISDDHHQSTLLSPYPQVSDGFDSIKDTIDAVADPSYMSDDFDSIKNIIEAVANPLFVPSSSGEQDYGLNMNCDFPIEKSGAAETSSVPKLIEDEVMQLVSPHKRKSHKAKKDPQPRGRPRKNCANQLPFAQPLPQIQAPLVATGIDELAELASVNYRRKSKNDANHVEDEEEERERQAILEALPSNLRNQLKKEKEGRKKGSNKNSISGGAIVTPTESFEDELSTDTVLSILENMTTTDPRSFLAGLKPNTFGNSESPDFPPEVVSKLLENFIVTLEQPLIKPQQDKEPEKVEELPPPLATFFAVAGVRLCILYENPVTIGHAPIWTDNSGPLLPYEWYRDGPKIKRRQMLTHPGLITLLEEIERSKNLPPKEPVFKPKIVTKAALKWMPESMQVSQEFTAPQSPASLKRKMDDTDSHDTSQPTAKKEPSDIEFCGNPESGDIFFQPPAKVKPSEIELSEEVESDNNFQPPEVKEPSEIALRGIVESDDTFQPTAKVKPSEIDLSEEVESDDNFQPPAVKEPSDIELCGTVETGDNFQPPEVKKPSEIELCGNVESDDNFQPSAVKESSEIALRGIVESDVTFQPTAKVKPSEINLSEKVEYDDTFQLPAKVKPSEIEFRRSVESDVAFFQPPEKAKPSEIEFCGEIKSVDTFFEPPAEKELSEIKLSEEVESDNIFQPLAKVKPSEIKLCGIVESVPEPLHDSTPVNEGPFKIERITVQKFKPEKNKNKNKKLGFRTVNSLRKFITELQVFTDVIFETIKSEGIKTANAISSLVNHRVAEDINRQMNNFVQNCATAAFKYGRNVLLCRTGESTVTEFAFDSTSLDSGPRWCSWHEALVNSCVKNVTSKLVANKMKELRGLVKPAWRWLKRIKDPSCKKEASEYGKQIRSIYDTLEYKMDEFKKFGQLQLHRTFEFKYRAIKQRAEKWIAVKNNYREVELEREITSLKRAAVDFIGAPQRGRQNRLWPRLKKLCNSLFHLIQTHDAVVDVCMFASRLQALYYHAHEVFKDKVDVPETHKVLQSLEDTEHLFILAETKVLLLQMGNKSGRIQLIDAYIQGDAFNVEKGRLRRLMMSKAHPQVRKNNFPSGNWETVIRKEEDRWRKTEKPGRRNFFEKSQLKNFDYALAIPPVFLSETAGNHTLTQMFMTLPQMTSLVDEKFKSIADADKREPKMYIQAIVPLFRMQPKGFQIPHFMLSTRKRPHKNEEVQELPKSFEQEDQELLKRYRHQLATSGTVASENGENCVPSNRGKHDEKQLDEETLRMLKNMQRLKMEQELKRMQIMESAFKNILSSEGNVVDRKIEELSSHDLANAKVEHTKGIKFNPKKTEQNIPPSKQEQVVSSEYEPEDDVSIVLCAIQRLTEQKASISNKKEKRSKRQEIEFLTDRFVHLQKIKAASMQKMTSRVQNNWPRTVTVADPQFEHMLDSLEFYDGYLLDKMDAVDFESGKLEGKYHTHDIQPFGNPDCQPSKSTKNCRK